jgi:hypothetical protein
VIYRFACGKVGFMPLYRINEKLILFVHIPKTGGSSLENELGNAGKVCFLEKPEFFPAPAQHLHFEILNTLFPSDFYDRGFAVCRNPYTRLISEYRHQVVRGRLGQLSFDRWVRQVLHKYQRNSFLHHNHIRPQVEFVSDAIEVFRFEEGLEKAFQRICEYCGVSVERVIPQIKRYEKSVIQIKSSTLMKIKSFYKEDFGQFGYDPDDYSFAEKSQVVVVARGSKKGRIVIG